MKNLLSTHVMALLPLAMVGVTVSSLDLMEMVGETVGILARLTTALGTVPGFLVTLATLMAMVSDVAGVDGLRAMERAQLNVNDKMELHRSKV
jgi:hypothetical protein